MCADIIRNNGIKRVKWPANSPDLHPIEDIWDQEKELLSSKWKQLRGAGKGVQNRARKEVAEVGDLIRFLLKLNVFVKGRRPNWRSVESSKG